MVPIFLAPIEGAILYAVLRLLPHKVDRASEDMQRAVLEEVAKVRDELASSLLSAAVAMQQAQTRRPGEGPTE